MSRLVHPMFKGRRYGDYDHLARVREWSLVAARRAANERWPATTPAETTRAPAARPPTRASRPGCRPMPARARPRCSTRRVIRLLLAGAAPAAILCLTFTKAAAANDANRIFATLGAWAAMDDAALGRAIAELSRARPGAARLARARRLFAARPRDAGRAEDPDHPRLLRARCCTSSRSRPMSPAQFAVLDERERRRARSSRARRRRSSPRPMRRRRAARPRHGPHRRGGRRRGFAELLGEVSSTSATRVPRRCGAARRQRR